MKAFNKKKYISGKSATPSPFWKVVGLGALAGMRTFSAPVIANTILQNHPSKYLSPPLSFLQSDKAGYATRLLAIGELVADKLPDMPNRIAAPGLIGRCLSGALAGAGIYKATGNKGLIGAAIGSSVALASSFGSFFLRRAIAEKTGIPDPVIGGIEDAVVMVGGVSLIISA